MEVLKTIDWTQVGPFTAFLLIVAVVMLVCAPSFFKLLFKREDSSIEIRKEQQKIESVERQQRHDMEAADRARRSEQEGLKDKALIDFIRATGVSIDKISEAMARIGGQISGSESRIIMKVADEVQASAQEIRTEMRKEFESLRSEIRNENQDKISKELAEIRTRTGASERQSFTNVV